MACTALRVLHHTCLSASSAIAGCQWLARSLCAMMKLLLALLLAGNATCGMPSPVPCLVLSASCWQCLHHAPAAKSLNRKLGSLLGHAAPARCKQVSNPETKLAHLAYRSARTASYLCVWTMQINAPLQSWLIALLCWRSLKSEAFCVFHLCCLCHVP